MTISILLKVLRVEPTGLSLPPQLFNVCVPHGVLPLKDWPATFLPVVSAFTLSCQSIQHQLIKLQTFPQLKDLGGGHPVTDQTLWSTRSMRERERSSCEDHGDVLL